MDSPFAFRVPAALIVAALGLARSAAAQHADVVPSVANGRLATSGRDDATGENFPGARVFGYDFGEDAGDPYFAGDPGFNAPNGSLPGGSQLSFNVPSAAQAGLPRSLSYWSGTGGVSFTPVPTGESLRLSLGAGDLTITGTGSGPLTGFPIGTATPGGSIHRHLNAFLNGSDGNNTPGDGVVPADGIYAFAMGLTSSDPSVLGSPTIYMVFNNGLTEAAHDAAIGYVETAVVPEPASIGLAGVAAVGLLARRRRPTA